MDKIIRAIDAFVTAIGRLAMVAVLAILALVVAEIGYRAVVGRSLSFVEDLASWLLVAVVFLGGPLTLARSQFVRVDALYEHYGPKSRALLDTLVSSVLMGLFLYAMIRLGGAFVLKSFNSGEVSATGSWSGPVWIAKALVPLGSSILGLAWISHILKLWRDALRGGGDDV